jgi:glycosyltransferase involved in cell wall biosynthesis
MLAGCLASLAQQSLDELEMIVVDNGSTDETLARLDTWSRAGSGRVVVSEPAAGLSRARNRGLDAAHGDVVLFLDDDAVAPPSWAFAHVEAYRHEDVVAVGGPIVLAFPDGRPAWAGPELEHWWSALNDGDEPQPFPPDKGPYGANMSVRRSVALSAGGFSVSLGRIGASLLSSEEADLFERVRGHGTLWYEPAAIIAHKVTRERLRPAWLLRRGLAQGRTNARREGVLKGLALRNRCVAIATVAFQDIPPVSCKWLLDPRARGQVLNDLCRRGGHVSWAAEHLYQRMRTVAG